MRQKNKLLLIASLLNVGFAQAAGPLLTTDSATPQPFIWDTAKGTIPVYVDGGAAFTYDYDGSVFLTIDRAREITQFAFDQWNHVETSSFRAEIAGTIEQQLGIADVTGANAAELYTKQNGYGIWVLYDTDGSILEDFFGVPKSAVLGIAFPEIADENNVIIEATAVWYWLTTTNWYGLALSLCYEQSPILKLWESVVMVWK